jgi:hypothetical protein
MITIRESPILCALKNIGDHARLITKLIINIVIPKVVGLLRIYTKKLMNIITYRIDHAIGNTAEGGFIGDFFSVSYHCLSFIYLSTFLK